jgi:hypothetical protein
MGLLFTVLVAGAFLAAVVTPRRCTPAPVQIGVVILALLASSALGGDGGPFVLACVLAFGLMTLVALLPEDREPGASRRARETVLISRNTTCCSSRK